MARERLDGGDVENSREEAGAQGAGSNGAAGTWKRRDQQESFSPSISIVVKLVSRTKNKQPKMDAIKKKMQAMKIEKVFRISFSFSVLFPSFRSLMNLPQASC